MNIKSALRDWLSVSYGMKTILLTGSLRSPPPIRLPLSGCAGFLPVQGQNKTPRNTLFINGSTVSTGCCATSKRGKGGGASHQRGNAFPRAERGRSVFRRSSGRYKNWRRKRRTSPAQRYYITPEGESPQTACKAKPITGRTLAAQGRKARRLAQPSRRSRVNRREYWKAPPRSRSRSRPRHRRPTTTL